jgi:hypothetical protein
MSQSADYDQGAVYRAESMFWKRCWQRLNITKFVPGGSHRCVDELIEELFILWADSWAEPPGTWPVSHITVATAETHHSLPRCAHIQQTSTNVNGVQFFFCMEELTDTSASYTLPSCQALFCQTAPLLYKQHPPLMPWPNILKLETLLLVHPPPPPPRIHDLILGPKLFEKFLPI